MEYSVREISNAVMIDSLDSIIQQESLKLEMDKNTGLIAKKSKLINVNQSIKQNESTITQNIPPGSHTTNLNPLCDHVDDIDRSLTLYTHSPSYLTKNNNKNSFDVKHNQVLLKEKLATYNVFDNYNNVLVNAENRDNLLSPDIKVRRNVRFGEYSPLNSANQVNAQPYLGIGEYESKRKKILELQRKEYIDHYSKAKQENNVSNLPKLPFSCASAFKSAMENNNSEQIKLGDSTNMHQEDTKQIVPPFVESCAFNAEQLKNANKLKQELYRSELNKQIEEKKMIDLQRKHREQMENNKIERAARDQETNIKRAYDIDAEKRIMAQLQKQLQHEKLRHEIMQKQNNLEKKPWSMPSVSVPRKEKLNEIIKKQKDLGKKSRNMPSEILPQQVSKHIQSHGELFENRDTHNIHVREEFNHSPQNTFDNLPLPTTRNRVPRKITFNEECDIINSNISYNKDILENSCIPSPPVSRPIIERAHVSFAKDTPIKNNEYNPAALLPITKNLIVDSPLTLALAGLDDNSENFESIEPIEETCRNQISKKVLLGNINELPTDKLLLSNLGNIRKQLDIEHQKLKQLVRKTQ